MHLICQHRTPTKGTTYLRAIYFYNRGIFVFLADSSRRKQARSVFVFSRIYGRFSDPPHPPQSQHMLEQSVELLIDHIHPINHPSPIPKHAGPPHREALHRAPDPFPRATPQTLQTGYFPFFPTDFSSDIFSFRTALLLFFGPIFPTNKRLAGAFSKSRCFKDSIYYSASKYEIQEPTAILDVFVKKFPTYKSK